MQQITNTGISIAEKLRPDHGGIRQQIVALPAIQNCSGGTTLHIMDGDGTTVRPNC